MRISGGRSFQAKERICTKALGQSSGQHLKNNPYDVHCGWSVVIRERERGDIKEKYGTIWLFNNFAVYFKSSGKTCRVLSNKLHDLT